MEGGPRGEARERTLESVGYRREGAVPRPADTVRSVTGGGAWLRIRRGRHLALSLDWKSQA